MRCSVEHGRGGEWVRCGVAMVGCHGVVGCEPECEVWWRVTRCVAGVSRGVGKM